MLVFFTNLSLTEFQVRYLALLLVFLVIGSFKWFWMGNLHEIIQLMLEFLKGPFLVLHFSYYTLITFLMMLSVIFVSMLMILLSTLNVIRHLVCGNKLELTSELESDLQDIVDCGRKWLVDFNAGKIQLVSFDPSKTLVLLMWKWRGLLSRTKSSFKMLGLTFSSKLDCGSCIISVAKTASRKIGALIHSMKFLSPEVSLYLYKLTIGPCMEYCCNVWAGAPRCYSQLLDKLQKWICRTVGPSFRCCLSWNLASSLKCSQLKSFL